MEGGQRNGGVAEKIENILNEDRELVVWCFVKWPEEDVCQLSIGLDVTVVNLT